MSLNIAIQMDPPEKININKDSTFVLALEAQKRGHQLSYYSPETLSLNEGAVKAQVAPVKFRRKSSDHVRIGAFEEKKLNEFDLILMRQDFNDPLSYNAITHILGHLKDEVLILNDPEGVREAPEKILITHYPEFAPPTLISRNIDEIRSFQQKHGEIIIKPMNGFGGLDIYHMKQGDMNLQAVLEMMGRLHPEPFIIQRYIPEVRHGDKRIIVVEGEPVAAVLRVPQANSARANLGVGGTAAIGEITQREREICKALKPELIKRGLVFVGLDMIGDYVTEINPKSPTGLQHIYKLQGIKCEESIWDAYEKRYEEFRRNS